MPESPTTSDQMPEMTVARALELPVLRHGLPKIVAGTGSLGRPIRWVHAGEVPNIAALLAGGELLLTTGMGIGAAGAQRDFVGQLSARGVAGFVVELGGTFPDGLPPALVAAAERDGLPLIELHTTVRFVAVSEAIHTEIVNRDGELLRRLDTLSRRFTATILDGGGVPGVLALLARAVKNPVFLESHEGRLLAQAAVDPDTVEALAATWGATRGRADAGIAVSVATGRPERHARLLSLPLERPFEAGAPQMLERAADAVALALMGSRREEELLAVGHGHLLTALAEGRIDAAVAAARVADLGLAGRELDGLLPVVARMAGRVPREVGASEVNPWACALRELEREVAALGVPTLVGVGPSGGDLLVLVGVRRDASRTELADAVAGLVHAAAARSGREVVVAVAGVAGWPEVGPGLRDAADAAALAEPEPGEGWTDATARPLDILVGRLCDHEELRRYVDRTLDPLLRHDAEHRRKLLPTLEALCATGGRRAVAARELHLNRQTLYAHIKRLESTLDIDLSDAATLTALHFAILVRKRLRG